MTPQSAAAVESLLAFWAEAGVDAMLLDAPIDRIEAGKFVAPKPVEKKPLAVAPQRAPANAGPDVSSAIAQAQALAAACQDLEALKAAISSFDGCPLKFEGAARQAVFARGAADAPLVVIGEGPGAEEDARGEPFVGRAGQLLDRMLAAAGLTDRVFITNTVFWRPPGNRTPTEAETTMCLPFLLRTIELQKPDIIVCLGATPAHRLTGKTDGILKLRGKWTSANVSGRNIPLLPTLHPAYLLRQPAQKRLAWRDMLQLRQMLDAH